MHKQGKAFDTLILNPAPEGLEQVARHGLVNAKSLA